MAVEPEPEDDVPLAEDPENVAGAFYGGACSSAPAGSSRSGFALLAALGALLGLCRRRS